MGCGTRPGPIGVEPRFNLDRSKFSGGATATPGPLGTSDWASSRVSPNTERRQLADFVEDESDQQRQPRSAPELFDHSGRDLVQTRAQHRVLQHLIDEYTSLTNVIEPYDTLKQRTLAFNSKVRRAYALSRKSLEYASLRLDAEHFVDARFYDPFKDEFRALNIHSPGQMPAFAVHYEYHIRSLDSLTGQAQSDALIGRSLTREKLGGC